MNEEDCGDAQGVSSAFGVASAKGGEQMSGAFRPIDAPSSKEDNIMNERKSQMNGKPNGFTRPIREEIAARAHRIWEQEGLPPGREFEHWQRAERELTAANSRSQERGAPLRSAI